MNTVCPNCRSPTAVDAMQCANCGASFSSDAAWKPARPDQLPRPDTSPGDPLLRISIVPTIISFLCISAFAIYFLVTESGSAFPLFLVPFAFHAIAFVILLRRRGATATTTSIVIGTLGSVISLPLFVLAGLAAAIAGTYLLFFSAVVYFVCQVVSVVQGVKGRAV